MHHITRACPSRFLVDKQATICGHIRLQYVFGNTCDVTQLIVNQSTTSTYFSSWSKIPFHPLGHKCFNGSILSMRFIATQLRHLIGSHIGTKKTGARCASDVALTSSRYKEYVTRGKYEVLNDLDVSAFEKILPGRVTTNKDELMAYNTDWLKTVRGESQVLLRPKTTEEVSAIVKYCYDHNLAISPQGGNTGMVGGSVPVFDEVIVSTQLMNKIINLDPVSGILVCQAGCILDNLYQYVHEHDLTMPLDLGSKGSCNIGGNLATNAGGIRLLRYGSLHGSVLGIEAVLPDGQVLDCISTMRKDNTGYDLKQLFIGSEGTLGIITGVSIICPQRPRAVSVAFLGCESFSGVLDVYKSCKTHLGEVMSAFEFLDGQSMTLIKENLAHTNPLSADYPFYVLVECSGSNGQHDQEKLMSMLQHVMDKGQALDGTIATDLTRVKKLWSLRENCTEALMHDGYCYKYDVSLPMSAYYKLVEDMRERLQGRVIRVVAYGHVGDGNLHLNMTAKEYSHVTMALIEPFIYDWVAKYHGSVSAEHGLGFKKKNFIYHSKTPSAVSLMAAIKQVIDPKGIMNPYKVLPDVIRS